MVAATAPQFRMAQHHDRSDAEDRGSGFETGDNLGRRHVSGKPADEEVADSLIEHQFDRCAGIGTREHGGEGLLLLGRLSMQQLKVVFVSRHTASHVALIALDEFA
jgi:hypothetical protein